MSYCIQASPLTKLFMRQYQNQCAENPEFVFDDKPFTVLIPRSAGAIIMQHNVPVHTAKLMPVYPDRVKDAHCPNELENLILWLTGGPDGMRSEETDVYGVVSLKVDLDVAGSILDLANLTETDTEASKKKAVKQYQDLQTELVKRTKSAYAEAQALADLRVRRALKNTHLNLMRQYETLATDGKGRYAPSVAEAVGAHILQKEIEKASATRRGMIDSLAKVMNETAVLSR